MDGRGGKSQNPPGSEWLSPRRSEMPIALRRKQGRVSVRTAEPKPRGRRGPTGVPRGNAALPDDTDDRSRPVAPHPLTTHFCCHYEHFHTLSESMPIFSLCHLWGLQLPYKFTTHCVNSTYFHLC